MFNKHRPDETIIFLSNPQHISDAWGPRRPKIRMSPPPHRTDNRGPRLSCPSTAAVSRSTPRQATVGRQRNVLVGPGAYSKPSHRWGLILRDWFFFVVFFFSYFCVSRCWCNLSACVRPSGPGRPNCRRASSTPPRWRGWRGPCCGTRRVADRVRTRGELDSLRLVRVSFFFLFNYCCRWLTEFVGVGTELILIFFII